MVLKSKTRGFGFASVDITDDSLFLWMCIVKKYKPAFKLCLENWALETLKRGSF